MGKVLFEDIFYSAQVNTNYFPDSFSTLEDEWNHKGFKFKYSNPQFNQVTVSVTYSPRWKAFIDGRPLDIKQKENLIVLDLLAEEHVVSLVYGSTKYVIWGYGLTLIGGILLLLFYLYYNIILRRLCRFIAFLKEWFEN